jgi:AbrB family looped-hinge helix DNA binding protein
MTKLIKINSRGTLTLPKKLRQRLGIEGDGQLIAEETVEGILLRPSVTLPLEIYNEKRLAEFARNNEEALAGQKFQKTNQDKPRRRKLFFDPLTEAERKQREDLIIEEMRKAMKVK